jgi:multiple sugar transport system permease protein
MVDGGAAMAGVPGSSRVSLSKRIDRLSDARFSLLLFAPAALIMAALLLPPILSVLGMSLFRIELLRPGPTRFLGLDNWLVRMMNDTAFLESIPRTIVFAAATTLLVLPLAMVGALVLNRPSRFAPVLGVALLLPWAIAPVVTGFFWRFMFQPTFGVITAITNGLGLTHGTVPWLQDSSNAMAVAVMATAWRTFPLLALLIFAALRSIPSSLYRAARMDGAGSFSGFRYVTLPNIRGMLLICAVLAIIISLQVFDVIFQLTRGGPGFDTTTMTYYIFDSAINHLSLGYSSAIALLLLAVIVAFSVMVYLARGRPKPPPVDDDEIVATHALVLPARATGRSALLAGSPPPAEARRRRAIRVPPFVPRLLYGLAAIVFVVWCAFPTVWIFIAALQPEGNVTGVPLTLSLMPNLDHLAELVRDPGWQSSLFVSLAVAIGTTVLTIGVGSLAAYPLVRYPVPGKNAFLGVLVFTQMVPGIVLGIPVLLLFSNLGLKDSIQGLILVNTAFLLPLAIWLLRNIFDGVPRQIEASARIDGCTRLSTLFRVTIPAARPGIAATAILILVSVWNEFLFAVILGDTGAVTITRRIGFINSPTSVSAEPPYTLQAAAGVLAVLPCVLLVLIFHRRIRTGLTEGYVKG